MPAGDLDQSAGKDPAKSAKAVDVARILEKIRSSGLYVYDSDAPLPTLEAWGYVS